VEFYLIPVKHCFQLHLESGWKLNTSAALGPIFSVLKISLPLEIDL